MSALTWSAVAIVSWPLPLIGLLRMLRRLPARLIRLPRGDYRLAPERRAATMARLADRLGWLGVVLVGFIAFGEELVVRASL
jgi:hypothetical protein